LPSRAQRRLLPSTLSASRPLELRFDFLQRAQLKLHFWLQVLWWQSMQDSQWQVQQLL
jgi:hypothetical protein